VNRWPLGDPKWKSRINFLGELAQVIPVGVKAKAAEAVKQELSSSAADDTHTRINTKRMRRLK
jgi:hypothetical protein